MKQDFDKEEIIQIKSRMKKFRKIENNAILLYSLIIILFFFYLFLIQYVGWWVLAIFLASIIIFSKLIFDIKKRLEESRVPNRERIAFYLIIITEHLNEYLRNEVINKDQLVKIKDIYLIRLKLRLSEIYEKCDKFSGLDNDKIEMVLLFKEYINNRLKPLIKEELGTSEIRKLYKELNFLAKNLYKNKIKEVLNFLEKGGIKKGKTLAEKIFLKWDINLISHIITILAIIIFVMLGGYFLILNHYIKDKFDIFNILILLLSAGFFKYFYPKVYRIFEWLIKKLFYFTLRIGDEEKIEGEW